VGRKFLTHTLSQAVRRQHTLKVLGSFFAFSWRVVDKQENDFRRGIAATPAGA